MIDQKRAFLTEFFGSLCLTFHTLNSGSSMGITLGYIALMMFGAKASGSHFNPAISLGMLVLGKASVKNCLIYMAMQLAGSVTACAFKMIIHGFRQAGKFDVELMFTVMGVFFAAALVLTIVYLIVAVNVRAPRAAFCFCVPLAQYFINVFSNQKLSTTLTGNATAILGLCIFTSHWAVMLGSLVGGLGGGALGGLLYKHLLDTDT